MTPLARALSLYDRMRARGASDYIARQSAAKQLREETHADHHDEFAPEMALADALAARVLANASTKEIPSC